MKHDINPRAFTLWWVSADRQRTLPCGEFQSEEAARDAIPAARAELLGQCGETWTRESIEAGSFDVESPRVI